MAHTTQHVVSYTCQNIQRKTLTVFKWSKLEAAQEKQTPNGMEEQGGEKEKKPQWPADSTKPL